MSIILKGIDMPKRGKTIRLEIEDNGTVWEVGYDVMGRLQDAQAIQIPTPHGRIIDADALELEKEVELADDWKTAHEIANCVKYAPTILESED